MTIRSRKSMIILSQKQTVYCISILLLTQIVLLALARNPTNRAWRMLSHDVITIQGEQTPTGYILAPSFLRPKAEEEIAIATLHVGNASPFDAILLTFEDLNLQSSNNCEGESVNIFLIDQDDYAIDPSKLVHTVCGSLRLEPLLLFSRNIVIQFTSDEFVTSHTDAGSRFRIRFQFMNATAELYNECERPNQYKCRNRKCISQDLLCDGFDDCGDASDENRWTPCQRTPTIPYKTDYKCGLASFGDSLTSNTGLRADEIGASRLMNRIVRGDRAQVEQKSLPQVSIQLIGIEPMAHVCGGSLIHPMFVLTSAHCFKDEISATNHKLLFGLEDLRRPYESQVQVRYANHISFYPNFAYKLPAAYLNDLDRANNLALIELNAPIRMNSHVWPACLPHVSETISAGRECVFTGFGETRGSGLAYALKQLKQSIVPGDECRSMFSDFKIDDYTMICIQNQNFSGPCKGDSGGPLLCRNDDEQLQAPVDVSQPEVGYRGDSSGRHREPGDIIEFLSFDDADAESESTTSKWHGRSRYTVHGVTSFTTDGNFGGGYCGFKESPTIYARVSNRIEWILTVLKLALPRLNRDDNLQDTNNRPTFFGYLFRSGYSQHANYTRPMTVAATTSAQQILNQN